MLTNFQHMVVYAEQCWAASAMGHIEIKYSAPSGCRAVRSHM